MADGISLMYVILIGKIAQGEFDAMKCGIPLNIYCDP
jgi:hypothetical protein